MKLWTGEPGRAEHAHLVVRAGPVAVVAVVEDDRPLDEEEREEAAAGEPADGSSPSPSDLEGLREHVEQRHRDHDPAGERDQRLELVPEPEGDEAAGRASSLSSGARAVPRPSSCARR